VAFSGHTATAANAGGQRTTIIITTSLRGRSRNVKTGSQCDVSPKLSQTTLLVVIGRTFTPHTEIDLVVPTVADHATGH